MEWIPLPPKEFAPDMSLVDASNSAIIALRTMRRTRVRQGASLDARRSIELVGVMTAQAQELEPSLDPIGAAREWLATRAGIDADSRALAERALDVASAYVRDIDETASAIARDARATGSTPDQVRIAEVETMAATLASFCGELRDVLGDVEAGVPAARTRLSAAVTASDNGGGVAAATVVLSAR